MKRLFKINKIYYVICLILFVACSVKSSNELSVVNPWKRDEYVISAQKNDNNRQIDLYIKNISNLPICIDSDGWPKEGRMDDCIQYKLEIVYKNRKIGFKESRCSECGLLEDGLPYRPDACKYRILPGKMLRGYLRYEDFVEDLSSMRPEEMTLNFPYPANACEDWKATSQPTSLLPQ